MLTCLLQEQAEALISSVRWGLLQDPSTATGMKQHVLQPLQANINRLRVAAREGGAGEQRSFRVSVHLFLMHILIYMLDVGRGSSCSSVGCR